MRIAIIKLITILFWMDIHAQSSMDQVLVQIGMNNKTIQATAQYYEAAKIQFKTGHTPSDPFVEYDYLSGSPANAGNQHDFLIKQQVDFPTSYIKKNQLAKEQIAQTKFKRDALRQDVLLEAKKYCIQLVYPNQLDAELIMQKKRTEKIPHVLQVKI